ncbi:MAG TPA: hypothetical protein VHA76_00975 [Solirubrobacterales bacterium]|nr:hypothetical protein [Solirubrobacterales bacterium]
MLDLAVGLAERGVAMSRFDEISHASAPPTLTVTEEYGPHPLAAGLSLDPGLVDPSPFRWRGSSAQDSIVAVFVLLGFPPRIGVISQNQ